MKLYIRATGNISPQKSFGHPPLLQELMVTVGNRLHCVEPDYTGFIDVKLIRRMSRIIKMGVAAAMECLQEAGIKNPDAIVTGTAYGCLEDTTVFLKKMVEQKEELLTPTAFIQSTHNTIGAQIALLLQCHNYNNTFVHRGFSFESALLDAMLLLQEGSASNVLVGGIDEITDTSFKILQRFGLYKKEQIRNADLFNSATKGTIAGEGASFFVLTQQDIPENYASLEGLGQFYKPTDTKETENKIQQFLFQHSLNIKDVDLVLTGRNGDIVGDNIYSDLNSGIFNQSELLHYKHLCGEYPSSTGFALWLAAAILKNGMIPETMANGSSKKIRRILIYNHNQNIHHSLFLLSAC
jgi:3-oxoacyl-(acyl-carrier-protein) synthase